MVLGIDDFKAKLKGGGARANLFKVTLNFPAFVGADVETASFMVKATAMPESTNGVVTLNFRGRQLKVAGDKTFPSWNVTVINDVDMPVRNWMEKWSNTINTNKAGTGLSNPGDYFADMIVQQLDKSERVTKTYDIVGAWPAVVSAIELSNDTTDAVEEFSIQFEYMYWESPESTK